MQAAGAVEALLCRRPPLAELGPHPPPPQPRQVNISILGLSLYASGWPAMGACIQLGLPVLVLITAFAFHLRRLTVFGCGARGLKVGLRDEQQGGAGAARPPAAPPPPTHLLPTRLSPACAGSQAAHLLPVPSLPGPGPDLVRPFCCRPRRGRRGLSQPRGARMRCRARVRRPPPPPRLKLQAPRRRLHCGWSRPRCNPRSRAVPPPRPAPRRLGAFIFTVAGVYDGASPETQVRRQRVAKHSAVADRLAGWRQLVKSRPGTPPRAAGKG